MFFVIIFYGTIVAYILIDVECSFLFMMKKMKIISKLYDVKKKNKLMNNFSY